MTAQYANVAKRHVRAGVINTLAENVLSPTLMGRGLNLSPTIVFLPFIFWAWPLGGSGAFLALPLTLFVAVMLETSPETRWIGQPQGIARHRGERSSRRGLACGSQA